MQVLYVNPMNYEANSAVDAVAHALDHRLAQADIELRVAFADFRDPDVSKLADEAVAAGVKAGVAGIAMWCLDSEPLKGPAQAAQAAGVPVFTLERPTFPVEASLVFPNFHHGMYMVDYLASVLPQGAKVAVIGGPEISDDDELVAGFLYALERTSLELLNDPVLDRYRNKTDVIPGGREAALRLLADVPLMDGLIAYNDETMLGALQALDEVGRAGEMVVLSRNGTPAAVEAIREGRTHATWDPDVLGIGTMLGGLIIRKLVEGEDLDGEVTVSPVGRVVNSESARSWLPYRERVPYRPLKTDVGG
jgi:ABC-type sugar transport system substrate-binding protein